MRYITQSWTGKCVGDIKRMKTTEDLVSILQSAKSNSRSEKSDVGMTPIHSECNVNLTPYKIKEPAHRKITQLHI